MEVHLVTKKEDHTFLGYGCFINLIFSSHRLSQIWTLDYSISSSEKRNVDPPESKRKQQQNVDRKSFSVLHHHPQLKITYPLGIPKIPSMFPKPLNSPTLLALQCTPTCAIATNTYMTHAVPEGAHRGKAPRRFSDTQRINLTCKVSFTKKKKNII